MRIVMASGNRLRIRAAFPSGLSQQLRRLDEAAPLLLTFGLQACSFVADYDCPALLAWGRSWEPASVARFPA